MDHGSVVLHKPRMIAVVLKWGKMKVLLISVHFPHHLRMLCCEHGPDSAVLIGADANARLELNCTPATGSLAFGDHDEAGSRFTNLLLDCGLRAPSTFIDCHSGPSHTWRHSKGKLSRIDFVLTGGNAMFSDTQSWVEYKFDFLTKQDDHWAPSCLVSFAFQDMKSLNGCVSKPKFDRQKMLTPEGRRLLAEQLQTIQMPNWDMDVHSHAQFLQDQVLERLAFCFPEENKGPRASFIPEEVWTLRRRKLRLKQKTRGLNETFTVFMYECVFALWRGAAFDRHRWKKVRILRELFATAIQVATAWMKSSIRSAKQEALRAMAARLGGKTSPQVYAELRHMGIGGKYKKARNTHPNLQRTDGTPVLGVHELDSFWLTFFNNMEAGTITSTEDFTVDINSQAPEDVDVRLSLVPTLLEIEEVYRRQPRYKACGLDGIPGEALKSCPALFARLYQPLYTKSVLSLNRPLQWRGGQLYECYKGSGSSATPENYRSLYVSSVVGKGLHKLLRRRITENTQKTFHPLQCGAKPGVSVTTPELLIQLTVRRAKKDRQALALLFLDTRQAYYRVIRELAVGDLTRDSAVIAVFKHFDLPPADVHALMDTIRSGGIMAQW